jgi:hypothetical protein
MNEDVQKMKEEIHNIYLDYWAEMMSEESFQQLINIPSYELWENPFNEISKIVNPYVIEDKLETNRDKWSILGDYTIFVTDRIYQKFKTSSFPIVTNSYKIVPYHNSWWDQLKWRWQYRHYKIKGSTNLDVNKHGKTKSKKNN